MAVRSAIAVIDIGKTNAKIAVFDENSEILDSVTTKTASLPGPPYPHLDAAGLWAWLIQQLTGMAARWPIGTIVPTTHGCAVALVDDRELVLPMLDYEAKPPEEITAAYRRSVPGFDECYTPQLPPGQHVAMHLFWLQQAYPDAFSRACHALAYPQYLAWRLGGAPASEISYLGAHTHLWAHRLQTFSSFARSMGWTRLFPPMRQAWASVGTVSQHVAERTGLSSDCRLLCGAHDSNAALLPYLQSLGRDFVLASTGTWAILFNPSLPLAALDPSRDMLANIDVTGSPVPTARFMGGREFEVIAAGDIGARPALDDVQRLIDNRTMALPNFAPGMGPFPRNRNRIVGPEPNTAEERVALASLYLTMMTNYVLDLLQSKTSDIVIDGAFVANKTYTGLIATLRPDQNVMINQVIDGTALGASLLASYETREKPFAIDLDKASPLPLNSLIEYCAEWLERARNAERDGD